MKKTIWLYLLSFCLLFFVFSTVYYFSYRNLEQKKELELAKEEQESKSQFNTVEAETHVPMTAAADGAGSGQNTDENAVAAGKKDGSVVTKDMLYISQNYDPKTEVLTETILPMPEDYLGLTREELISLMKSSDSGKSLVSFSASRLVVRSEEAVNPDDYRFLLILEEGYLKIYYSDRRDVYMETYLTEEELPDSELEVLKSGYYIKGVGELYDYLESITS
ncbi:hypothetical protein [Qiania dongpingensis]|uniref:Bypass of forespore C C-terminal domain-containing protein n=1 Tax=Qiania dongpingensis TaxID=2763669 RepID=A0A7G9G4V8_9FIRM|nr:hypothetical protein [Qiania dongpingensis]QNM05840.1 hypothetical protein H9Q78_01310 [Qiania dongpingensis]